MVIAEKPLKVLMVKDPEGEVISLAQELARGGYVPVFETVRDAESMRTALKKQEWEVVLAENPMPHFGGLEALRIIQETELDLPFILVSSRSCEDIAVEVMRAGANDYILKDSLKRLVPAIERELREAEVRRERQREKVYRKLFDQSKDAIFITTPEGMALDLNRAVMDILGYSAGEEISNIDILKDVCSDPADRKRFRRALDEEGYVEDVEFTVKKKNGEEIVVVMNATAIRDHHGNITAYQGIVRDITEKKRLEEQMLQSQKMESVGRLAGGIAHDFNNILTGIIGFADLALQDLASHHPLRFHLEQVRMQGERAAVLTRQLLAFSSRQVLERKYLDANEIILEMEKFLRRVIGENIELKVKPSARDSTVFVDPGQIEQVLMNLCVNARDAMPSGGCLQIETSNVAMDETHLRYNRWARPGQYVEVAVSDTGMGMSPEVMEHIFEPFFTTKEKGKGTGLGLATVYGIVRQHDGLIHAVSQPGKGTTFEVFFPAVQAAAEKVVEVKLPAAPTGQETILVAEDEETVRELVGRILRGYGYTVLTAGDGQEAIRVFEASRQPIHLALLDVIMPRMGGREAYQALRLKDPGLKFLFFSGYTGDQSYQDFFQQSGAEYLRKPFTPLELGCRVREVLDK